MSTLFIQTKIFKLDLVAKPSFKSLSGDNIRNTFKPSYNRDAMGKWAWTCKILVRIFHFYFIYILFVEL